MPRLFHVCDTSTQFRTSRFKCADSLVPFAHFYKNPQFSVGGGFLCLHPHKACAAACRTDVSVLFKLHFKFRV